MYNIKQGRTVYAAISMMLCLILLSCSQGKTIEFFVSSDGSDANQEQRPHPLNLLGKRRNRFEPVCLKPRETNRCEYSGRKVSGRRAVRFSSEDSGSEKAPVTYKAVKGEVPVFTGSRGR